MVARGSRDESSGSIYPAWHDTLIGIAPTTGQRHWSHFDSLGLSGDWDNSKWNYNIDNTFMFENQESKKQWIIDRSTGKTLLLWDYSDSTGHSEIRRYNLVGDTLLLSCQVPGSRRYRDFTVDVESQQILWEGDTLNSIEALDDAGRAYAFWHGDGPIALCELSLSSGQKSWDYKPSVKFSPGILPTRICGFTKDCVIAYTGATLHAVRKDGGLFKSRATWKTTFDCSQINRVVYQPENNLGNHLWLRTGTRDSLRTLVWLVDLDDGSILQQVDLSALSGELLQLPTELKIKWGSIQYFASGDTLIISTPNRLILFDGKSGRYTTSVGTGYVQFSRGSFSTFFLVGRYACVVDNARQLAVLYDIDRGEAVGRLALSTIGGRIEQVLASRSSGIIVAGSRRIVEFSPSLEERSDRVLAHDVLNRLSLCHFRLGSLTEATEFADEVLAEHDPSDASAASLRMLCSVVSHDSASISGQLRDYWSLMKDGQPVTDELLSTLTREFNLCWIASRAHLLGGPASLALSNLSESFLNLSFDTPGGQMYQYCSRFDGKERFRLLMRKGYYKDIDYLLSCRGMGLAIIPSFDYDSSVIIRVDSSSVVRWRSHISLPKTGKQLLGGFVSDFAATILVGVRNANFDSTTVVTVRVDTESGRLRDSVTVLSLLDSPTAWISNWRVTPNHISWESVNPKNRDWSCDSLIVFPMASLGQKFVFKTGTALRSISYAGDTVAAAISPDRYVAWDLNSREQIFDFAYRDGGGTFESGILYFGDQTIIDWDSTSIIALDLTKADSARPFRWRTPLKSLGKNFELTNRVCRFGNRLFLESADDRLVVLDFTSGRYLGQIKLLWPASEFVADNDRVYVSTSSGLVYAINYRL